MVCFLGPDVFHRAFVVAAAIAVLAPASAGAGTAADARAIYGGLTRAVAADRLEPAEAFGFRLVVRRCRAVLPLLPDARRRQLAAVLNTVAHSGSFVRPRAVALFGMLELNTDYLATHAMPLAGTDVRDGDGVVYRATWTRGLQFHPLANFATLNSLVSRRRDASAERLAHALAARAVLRATTGVWEYYFAFGGGRPPWLSGMAQAVAAQSLARAGVRYENSRLLRVARRAYGSVPARLSMALSAGPWVRLYNFNRLVVLNAQLQSVLSLSNYAALAGDAAAAAYARRMKRAAAAMLPRFDTGYWSRYSLGRESPLSYHRYVIGLLRKLGYRTGEATWGRAAARFTRYTNEPPLFKAGNRIPTLYPWPAEGYRDAARITFWVSKISTVTLTIAGERRVARRSGGWHAVVWRPRGKDPGTYRTSISAIDLAGNRGSAALRPIVIRIDRTPPVVRASVTRRTLTWRAVDAGTPWLRLRVRIQRLGVRKLVRLGVQPLAGSLRLAIPAGNWKATLVASDSSGNQTWVALGVIPKL